MTWPLLRLAAFSGLVLSLLVGAALALGHVLPNDGILTFVSTDAAEALFYVELLDVQHAIRSRLFPALNITNIALSPDGNRIAFTDLYGTLSLYDLHSDSIHTFELSSLGVSAPVWSPDGTRIAFVSWRDGNQNIYVLDALAALQTPTEDNINYAYRLSPSEGNDYDPVWSPDGTQLAFVSQENITDDIMLVNADGTNLRPLTLNRAADLSPEWSPTGEHIAFISQRDGGWNLYVMDSDAADDSARRLTQTELGMLEFSWSPDGQAIAYVSFDNNSLNLYARSLQAESPRVLTASPKVEEHPVWSPDGKYIVYGFWPGWNLEIHVLDLTTGTSRRVSTADNLMLSSVMWYPQQ